MNTRKPAEVFAPGEFIREALEERGWTQQDLATILGRPLQSVNQILTGKKAITPETAAELAEAFDTSAEFWLNLETTYRLSLAQTPAGVVRKRAELYGIAPVKEMERRQWIRPTKATDELEAELRRFFRTAGLDSIPPIAIAARAGKGKTIACAAHMAWGYRVKQLATMVRAARFSKQAFKRGLERLKPLEANPEDIRLVPQILADMGIRFVVVQHLQHTHIDGAAFLDDDGPIVAVSMRHDRIDWFWHTLLHELDHVWNKDETVIDVELDKPLGDDKVELRANQNAASWLIPQDELDRFIVRSKPYYSREKINRFADRICVHPGIVVGQLQHRGEVPYSSFWDLRVKVKDIVTSEALTDGWGQVATPQ